MRELKATQQEIRARDPHRYNAYFIRASVRYVLGNIQDPINSPCEGDTCYLVLRLPRKYPFRPIPTPFCLILTNVYHSSISPSGEVCLAISRDQRGTALTVSKTPISIASILGNLGL